MEADSPRGRIQLMLGLAEGKIEATESVRQHLDLCLDCRGCETACPSGVVYHELIEETRSHLAESQAVTAQGRFMRWMFFHVFTRPNRLKLALLPARILQRVGVYPLLRRWKVFRLLPDQLRKMEQMLPASGSLWPAPLPPRTAAHRPDALPLKIGATPDASSTASTVQADANAEGRQMTVGFFAGCIGAVLFDTVNRKAVDLLSACGAEVIVPKAQRCCGAIHMHNSAHLPAGDMARRNIDAFIPAGQPGVDFIVSTIAGCGAMLREYDVLLRDDPAYADRAKEFVKRVRDISEVLLEMGLPLPWYPVDQTVTYHDACHLAHGQKVTAAPRRLLEKVPGLKLVPLPESDLCCGAAGTYNLTQPAMSMALAERKLRNIARTGAGTCATGNVGCAMQIQSQADAQGQKLRVVHPVELLHLAVFGNGR